MIVGEFFYDDFFLCFGVVLWKEQNRFRGDWREIITIIILRVITINSILVVKSRCFSKRHRFSLKPLLLQLSLYNIEAS